jgi:signal peptidase I
MLYMTESTESLAVDQSVTQEKSKFREYAESIIWAVILALIIRTFVVQAYKIPSGSMEDTLAIGDHLLVNKFVYGTRIPFTSITILKLRDPKQGDVMVFQFPEDRSKDFIKRVIGVPGDVIQERDKQVFVNGVLYRNPHEVHKDAEVFPREVNPRDNFGPVTVPANSYFMMGDNRDRSYDSRFWGFIKASDIRGKAFIKYWSWDKDSWRVRWKNIGRLIN